MRQRELAKYLFDVAEACRSIRGFVAGKTLEDYGADELLRSGVMYQFAIIGEALTHLLRLDPSLAERITSAARIVAFRNRLVHEYRNVVDSVVWGVIEGSLPMLESEVSDLLEEVG